VKLEAGDFRACESGAEATALQTLREGRVLANYAKRLECVRFTAAFGRSGRGRMKIVFRACESGVAAAALPPQSKTRWRSGR